MVKTCKKHGPSALDIISNGVSSVIRKQAYPNVFNLINIESNHLC
ncbi:hypothetical protein BTN49_2648 [Candidatus Enterovibrio escicola]|uniref:Uncharacterized protein n=1 Tax=Candidatus Enterovibrio escicola TaxID=1927127 RepID=A0A2A5T0Y5_9GAMM|nr:hypothetical protein BTN49_2648 [Candidatus Enterovibrio escacola]